MSYGVAIKLDRGLVFAADTRTNAGVDNIAQFRKLHFWKKPGDRVIVLLSAGNLAITQSVISLLNERIASADCREREKAEGAETCDGEEEIHTLLTVPSLYRCARLVGDGLREIHRIDGPALEASASPFVASFILGGQIGGEPPRLFQIYTEGNFIEATDDTPFFQIGEHKYGKPILDRVARPGMSPGEAAKLVLLSFDSTIRSNLSVGMPIDIAIYERDTLDLRRVRRIGSDDQYFRKISATWSDALRGAFTKIEEPEI